jgi:hypothetical protein
MGFLASGLIVALAAIGIVNGLWSKNLVVSGTVETGDLNVDWSLITCSELHNWPGFPGSDPEEGLLPGEFLDKDVGSVTWDIGDPDGVYGDQVGLVNLHNAYPSYVVDCEIEWYNSGSIPFNFRGFNIAAGPEGEPLTNCVVTGTTNKQMLCDQVTVQLVDGAAQADPCTDPETNLDCPRAHSLRIHVEQPALQSDCTATTEGPGVTVTDVDCDPETLISYQFLIKICVAQWNEEATYEQCVNSDQHEGPDFEP